MRRIRGAFGMGLTWAAGWALGGIAIGVASLLLPGLPWGAFFEVFDAPLPALAIPGFVGGVIFSAVLGIAARGRSFHELSIGRFAAWGAVGGLLLSFVPVAMSVVGLLTLDPESGVNLWKSTAVISGPFMLFSALSAAGSLMVARRARGRALLEADDDAGALDTARPASTFARGSESGRARPASASRRR